MATYQCPLCMLRFLFRSEVEDHLATDHRRKRLRLPASPSDKAAQSQTTPREEP